MSIFVQPMRFASWYVVKVLPKRILAFQRYFAAPSSCDSKNAAVASTARICSGLIAKSCTRVGSKPMPCCRERIAASTSCCVAANHSPPVLTTPWLVRTPCTSRSLKSDPSGRCAFSEWKRMSTPCSPGNAVPTCWRTRSMPGLRVSPTLISKAPRRSPRRHFVDLPVWV